MGNLKTWSNTGWGTQTFSYDERDRLTSAVSTGQVAYDESYRYDKIGNLRHKAGVDYTYPAAGGPRPHAPTQVGDARYGYDFNGNLEGIVRGDDKNGTRRIHQWNVFNQLASVENRRIWTITCPEPSCPQSPAGHSIPIPGPGSMKTFTESKFEWYGYDADGERVTRTTQRKMTDESDSPKVTTVYFAGLWENTIGGAQRKFYSFNGQTIAQREIPVGQPDSNSTVQYLHPDHQGSVAATTTNRSDALTATTMYTPWGAVRRGGNPLTTLNYTGQRLDDSGLLHYHARYYDPGLGRFFSPDSVVPGDASGGLDGVALKALTVDFHEPGFVSALNGENQGGDDWSGPANPQALNRYSYVQNNPLRYTDPSGHTWYLNQKEAAQAVGLLRELAGEMQSLSDRFDLGDAVVGDLAPIAIGVWLEKAAQQAVSGNFLRGLANLVSRRLGAIALGMTVAEKMFAYGASEIELIAELIDKANVGDDENAYGVALQKTNSGLMSLNRTTGEMYFLDTPFWVDWNLSADLRPGVVRSTDYFVSRGNYFFPLDHREILTRRQMMYQVDRTEYP